jgi:predicted aspartyl protease
MEGWAMRNRVSAVVWALVSFSSSVGATSDGKPAPEAFVVPMDVSAARPSIELRINGKGPFRLLFDTGSGADLILDQELANDLGLETTGTRRIGDPNSPEAIEARVVTVDRVELGGFGVSAIQAISWKRDNLGGNDAPRGVVGLGLFGDRLVTLDYPRAKLTVEAGDLPEPNGGTVVAASFEDGIPSLLVDVAGVPFRAHLDSGSSGFVGLPLAAAEKLPLAAAPVQVGRARTASGDYAVSEARLQGDLRVGSIVLQNPNLRFVDLPIGNLGSDLLREVVVTVDRKNARVRLVPSGKPLEPTARPRLGIMTHGPKDGRIPVENVAAGSPADAAGVRAGDEIVRLNGRAVAEMSAPEVGVIMQSRPLTIGLVRDGKPIEVTVGVKAAAP